MYDVIVIGGGVIGCAVLRELSRWRLRLLLLERSDDVASGASKANSAIVHSGHSAAPGSLMARYNVLGNRMYPGWCRELGVPFQAIGSLNIAFAEAELPGLSGLQAQGEANGVEGLRMLSRAEVLALEPQLNPEVAGALLAPTGAITCPYELTVALAEDAVVNGAEIRRGHSVRRVSRQGELWQVETAGEVFLARAVVNAAGLFAGELNNQVSARKIRIRPRKGEYWMVDKSWGGAFRHTIFQLPGAVGKGILLSPTVDGTLILGPTAEDQEDPEDTSTTAAGLDKVLQAARRTWPALPREALITSFAGLRAHAEEGDFILGEAADAPGFFNAAGIESPGLTAAPALAADLAGAVAASLEAEPVAALRQKRVVRSHFRTMSDAERQAAIAADSRWGRIVCRCELVSEAEIVQAIHAPVGAGSLDAVKRRTRAGMGRCQGGFCSPRVAEILSRELGLPAAAVSKAGGGSCLLAEGPAGTAAAQEPVAAPKVVVARVESEPEVVIIGGGPAGLAAAIAAYDQGCRRLLVLEREDELGGILQQCIHTGFGLHVFGEELTGPEYAQRYIDEFQRRGIASQTGCMVFELGADRTVKAVSPQGGLQILHPRAVVLAMGCRERPRGALGIPGTRCAGVYNAGMAQRLVNLEGSLPGRRVVILGSGDIGLIMARRMVMSGAEVLAVVELMPYSGGLKRNQVQCLDDFGIPLLLSHTVTRIHGRERLEGVTVSRVDAQLQQVPGSGRHLACDTLLLSVGLIPENELSRQAGLEMSARSAGPLVDEQLHGSLPGFFACGNVLHVHDLVDHVSGEAALAGRSAAAFVGSAEPVPVSAAMPVAVVDGPGVRGCVPQRLTAAAFRHPLLIRFRPTAVFREAELVVEADGEVIRRIAKRILTPGEMVEVTLLPEHFQGGVPRQALTIWVEQP